jgi:CubicO group peptidase (beta-lactamase class C family)
MKLFRWVLTIALLASFASVQQAAAIAPCGAPIAIDDGWQIAAPEAVGMDGLHLCDIADRLKAQSANIHAVIIVRHGKLVFEQYYTGYDDPWGAADGQFSFDATTKHDMRSVSKSITSVLIGIAIDRKLIASVDEPLLTFFPQYAALKSTDWDKIVLRHLLTMSSGISWDEARAWNDPKNDEPHLGKDTDPIHYVLSKPIVAPPGSVWTYNGGGTDLLGNIIAQVSGRSLDAFAREALFQPLGISDWEWKMYENGKVSAAAGLRLRPRDAAKIGQLVLNQGSWNGKQIVTADWIKQSVKPRFQAIGYFGGLFFYGYQWWLGRTLSDGNEVTWIAAVGLGGQRLVIVPALDLVVMVTSGMYNDPRQGSATLDILNSIVMPAIFDKDRAH